MHNAHYRRSTFRRFSRALLPAGAVIALTLTGATLALARSGGGVHREHHYRVAPVGVTPAPADVTAAAMAAKGDLTLGRATQLAAAPAARVAPASAPSLNICSFEFPRSQAFFPTETGDVGYGQMRRDLLNASNFGPSGRVHRTVNIEPGVFALTTTDLAGCNVFFSSLFIGTLSSTEANALRGAVRQGMRVIADADDSSDEQAAVNSLLAALGIKATVGPAIVCPTDASGASVRLAATGNGDSTGRSGTCAETLGPPRLRLRSTGCATTSLAARRASAGYRAQ